MAQAEVKLLAPILFGTIEGSDNSSDSVEVYGANKNIVWQAPPED